MESKLNIFELQLLLDTMRKRDHDARKFAAALKGIDLDKGSTERFDELKRRAQAKARGQDEEQYHLGEIGVAIFDGEQDLSSL